jgi:hypothetical protein
MSFCLVGREGAGGGGRGGYLKAGWMLGCGEGDVMRYQIRDSDGINQAIEIWALNGRGRERGY